MQEDGDDVGIYDLEASSDEEKAEKKRFIIFTCCFLHAKADRVASNAHFFLYLDPEVVQASEKMEFQGHVRGHNRDRGESHCGFIWVMLY